jgi:citrate lyase subunit beta / citryl-CoA lyase
MIIRSWLFVPGDSERKMQKARENPADALILDMEDSVADDRQEVAREMVCDYLKANPGRSKQQLWVRINPLDNNLSLPDLAAILKGGPDGIVLPKVYSVDEVNKLADYLDILEIREGIIPGTTKIVCVATETAASLLTFHTYLEGVSDRMVGMTWGGEDLAASLGASDNRHPRTGDYDDPFLYARTMCLATARAVDVQPIGVVYVDYKDTDGLLEECLRDRRSGFVGKVAIHPGQPAVINQAFTPSEDEVAHAKKIVQVFEDNPGLGTIGIDGKMYDMPHLKQARNLLELSEQINARTQ